jgi:hypothetical protein
MQTWRVASWVALGMAGAYLAGYAVARRMGLLTHIVWTVPDTDSDRRHVRCRHGVVPPIFLPVTRFKARVAAFYRPVTATEVALWTVYRDKWTTWECDTRCGFTLPNLPSALKAYCYRKTH